MTIDLVLVVAGVIGVAVAALSERIRRLPLSEPLGLLAGILLVVAAGVVLHGVTAAPGRVLHRRSTQGTVASRR